MAPEKLTLISPPRNAAERSKASIRRTLRKRLKQQLFAPQKLTDRRFMSRTQREAFDKGEEIWV